MQTLKVRMRQLSFDIDARARELDDLKRQIEGAQEGGAGVACGRGWATKIGRWMRARKVEWRAEALEAQLGAISSSLENLPLAFVLDAKRIRARKPPKRDVQRRQQASKHRYARAPDLRRIRYQSPRSFWHAPCAEAVHDHSSGSMCNVLVGHMVNVTEGPSRKLYAV
jgi:hypothetical protein